MYPRVLPGSIVDVCLQMAWSARTNNPNPPQILPMHYWILQGSLQFYRIKHALRDEAIHILAGRRA